MAFRDSFDKCPRCAVTLEDAQSARGCRACGGVFVEEPVLAEMLIHMLPPPPRALGRLALSEVKRTGQQLGCPSCGDAMTPTTIHEVELDHCKKHGVWFDPDELRITLYRVADPRNPPPFNEWAPVYELPAKVAPAPPPRPAAPAPGARQVVFQITEPGRQPRNLAVLVGVIKIGKVQTAHLRIDNDPQVSRLHAVIEVNPTEILLIDLGSATGTHVNDKRCTKALLNIGDTIRIGGTTIQLLSA